MKRNMWISDSLVAQEGDVVELLSSGSKFFILTLESGMELQTHRGIISHDDLIGKEWGSKILSHKGSQFYLIQPGISDILQTTKRNTQIMYPKDIGYILIRLNITPGTKIIEAGTGSGSLTQALALFVGDEGHIYSYESREDMLNLAKKNIARLGLSERVTFFNKDISVGFEGQTVDAVFLDLPNPYDFIGQVKSSLNPGGFFGTILPTTNQVLRILTALRRYDFQQIDVCEILLRFYQAQETKFRPVDRMVAHTGFLIFARSVANLNDAESY